MEEDDSDDNVSLVSRTPSPPPQDRMDVDKYDEYTRGVEREVITVDTKISSANKGFAMLAKLGWVEGQPLGLSGEGARPAARMLLSQFPHVSLQAVLSRYRSCLRTTSRAWARRIRT